MKSKQKQERHHNRTIAVLTIIFISLAAVGIWQGYRLYFSNLTSRDGEAHRIYIYPETTISTLLDTLTAHYQIASPLCLRLHARMMSYPAKGQQYTRTGSYIVPAKCGDKELIQMFRNGWQTPVKVSFRNIRTQAQLSARLASQLMLDSADIASRLGDKDYMKQFDLTIPTAVCLFLPDTYEMYWDITPDRLFQRMYKEYSTFWTEERQAKASALHLKPWEVATIASIVEEETNRDEDKPVIAGLYLNRLRIGMPLQSCPTLKFALQDFTLRRILNKHLETDSPYNTYRNAGLPPGPIRIPTAKTMDYVLNPVKSNYLFMCASTAFDGTHHFSATYREHAAYARQYHQALDKRGIK
ncbi:MAG: endolytic transglycosylase MltG [Paludibacteraceae bacterium]|nr:endolytic transglycosylase MltG [Paludibacteraceae bacterium]